MKDTKRALRRHHRQRMIARARRVLYMSMRPSDPRMLDWARRNYNHLKKCSCWMCGHRRKWYGPTIQERRHWPSEERDVQAEASAEFYSLDDAVKNVPEDHA